MKLTCLLFCAVLLTGGSIAAPAAVKSPTSHPEPCAI
jgi:hypothetical protein